jgi:outer membrane protein assembly factor BamD (BamD/ComL family)
LALPSEASFSSDLAPERARHLAESRRVADARALLLAGDARRALLELEAVRKDFPRGLLAQEREALAIEALGLLGERSEARQRADNFLRQYPGSPHATVVRKFLE